MRPFALALALACAACHKSAAPPKATIAFVEDDYEGALARAKSEHRPLFVDAWAPWCHTCLSMKAYVFGDPILAPVASKFVWAAIDTEKVKNDAFTRKFEMQAWPTLWVIDSATEKPTLKWLGSVTANELVTLLEAATGNAQATSGASEAAAAWIRGNREVAEQHPESAIVEYRDALARAPASWALRARVVETLILQLRATQQNMDCLNLAHREFATMPRGTSRLDVVLAGVACGEAPLSGESANAFAELIREVERMAMAPDEPILADDRSSLYEELVAHYREAHDADRAKSVAGAWRDFLANEAARASDPAARAVFDSHRIDAYAEAGEPEKAVAMLEQSERDFPGDYNPPTRLARVNLQLGRLDIASTAIERALTRVYGPRTLRVMALKADILEAQKKPDEAKAVVNAAVALGEKLPLSGGYRRLLDQLRARAAKP